MNTLNYVNKTPVYVHSTCYSLLIATKRYVLHKEHMDVLVLSVLMLRYTAAKRNIYMYT